MMSYEREREEIRKELQCKIYPLGSLQSYKFVVVCAFYRGEIILSKHQIRDTWETQGGHIEEGEAPLDAAQRELFEEGGIVDAELFSVCDYYGYNSERHSNGVVFAAVVHSISDMPHFEMSERKAFGELPSNLTYPKVTPVLFQCAAEYLKKKGLL